MSRTRRVQTLPTGEALGWHFTTESPLAIEIFPVDLLQGITCLLGEYPFSPFVWYPNIYRDLTGDGRNFLTSCTL